MMRFEERALVKKCTVLRRAAIFLFTMGLLVGVRSGKAMIPFYAHDDVIRLYDWTNEVYVEPEVAKLIKENAAVFQENFSGNYVDASLFEGSNKTVHYLGMTNLYFGGLRSYLTTSKDLLDHEENFYHSTDPATLVARRTGTDSIELHWAWDYRFERMGRIFDGNTANPSADVVRYYRISRRTEGGPWIDVLGRLYDAFTEGGNTFIDTSLDVGWIEYSYKVDSWYQKPGDIAQMYEYSDPDIAPRVTNTPGSGIFFWLKRARLEEEVHEAMRGATPSILPTDVISWPITFGVSASIPPTATIELEVYTSYRQNGSGVWTASKSSYTDFDASVPGRIAFDLNIQAKHLEDAGGVIYRLHYSDGTQDSYFPEPQTYIEYPLDSRIHLIRSSVNNRVMGNHWHNYQTRIEGPGQEWRSKYIAMVNELQAGVTPPGTPETHFDGIFMDSAVGNYADVHNTIRGYEYVSDEAFLQANIDFVLGVDLVTSVELYPNCFNPRMLEAISASPGVRGHMIDNLCLQPTGFFQWMAKAMWSGRSLPTEQMWYYHGGYDFRVPNPLDPTETGPDLRKQCLVTYLILKNDPSSGEVVDHLFGYGERIAGGGGGTSNPDLINILPEQFLGFLNPIPGTFAIGNLGAQEFLDEMAGYGTGDPAGRLWVANNTTLVKNGHFWVREFEYEDGIAGGSPSRAWAIIDVGTGSGNEEWVSFADLVPDKAAGTLFRLELENQAVQVTNGAFVESVEFQATDDPWLSGERGSVVVFEQPVRSPTIGTDFYDSHIAIAEYSLPSASSVSPVLAVRVSQWNGQRMQEVRVAANRAIFGGSAYSGFVDAGWPDDVLLTDDGLTGDADPDDGIYSAYVPAIPGVALGSYELPVIVKGTDGLMRFGTVSADVVPRAEVLFVDKSAVTAALKADLTGQPYSAVYLETDAEAPGSKLLLVTKDNDDPQQKPQLFRQAAIHSGVPVFQSGAAMFVNNELPSAGARGICYADFDNDGDEDIFICNVAQPQLYENRLPQGGSFADVTSAVFGTQGLSALAGAHVATWGDYNHDGWVDLYVSTISYSGTVGEIVQSSPGNPDDDTGGGGGGTGDLWNVTFSHTLFRNEFGTLVRTTGSLASLSTPAWSASFNDVDADGLLDLVIGKLWGGNPTVYLNTGYHKNLGDNSFAEDEGFTTSGVVGINSLDWIDYDHNQYPDMVVTDFGFSGARILVNDGSSFSIAEDLDDVTQWNGATIGDFDLNGQEDVLLLPITGQPELHVWSEPGYQNMGPVAGFSSGGASGALAADFNRDGDLDLYLGRTNDREFLYQNVRTTSSQDDDPDPLLQNYIEVILETLGSSNRSLIGARVLVSKDSPASGEPAEFRQTVDGGSGRGGQKGNRLHFGLGAYSGTVTVEVAWPSGGSTTESAIDPSAGHEVTITEDQTPAISIGPNFTHEPFPGGADWVFMWVTDVKGDIRLDSVQFINSQNYASRNQCYAGASQNLAWGDPNVTIRVEPHPFGGWAHTLVWKNKPCLAGKGCQFEFTASSGIEGSSVVSSPVGFGAFDVCIPDIPIPQQ